MPDQFNEVEKYIEQDQGNQPEAWSSHVALPQARAMIGRWPAERYIDILRWPMAGGLAVIILLALFGVSQLIITVCELVLAVGIGWAVARKGAQRTETLAAGGLMGAAIGLGGAVGKLIAGPSLTAGINLIFETMLTAIVGALLAVAGLFVWRLIQR